MALKKSDLDGSLWVSNDWLRGGIDASQCKDYIRKANWGSRIRDTRHIWLDVEMATRHPDYPDCTVVHEMTHYFERSHGEAFTEMMDKHMSGGRGPRAQLNGAPLASEDWAS